MTGFENTAAGLSSGYQVTGNNNSGLGHAAGQFVTGHQNTVSGYRSGLTVVGSSNSALGDNAGRDVTGDANIAIGLNTGRDITASNSIAMGTGASATRNGAIAIGSGARATKPGAVAIGSGSIANDAGIISIGKSGQERRIVNVAQGINPTDAVNLAQVQAIVAALAPAASEPVRGPAKASGGSHRTAMRNAAALGSGARGSRHEATAETQGDASDSSSSTSVASDDLEPSTIVGWANFNADGTLSGQRNIAKKIRYGVGAYEVVFKKKTLRNCTYNAMPAQRAGIAVSPGALRNSLRIEIRNSKGLATDAAFNLVAIC